MKRGLHVVRPSFKQVLELSCVRSRAFRLAEEILCENVTVHPDLNVLHATLLSVDHLVQLMQKSICTQNSRIYIYLVYSVM